MKQQSRERSTAGFWISIVLLSLFLLFSMALNAGLFLSLLLKSGTRSLQDKALDEYPKLSEKWSSGKGDVKAVRITLEGVIMRSANEGLFSKRYDKIQSIKRQIKAAQNDASVRAILLELDSPGGAITPSDEIYHILSQFRASREDRRIIVHMRDLTASGAYYVAMAGDWLIAEPTTIVGSIGVIMQSLNWKGLGERLGLRDTTIKSGPNKDLLNPFHDVPQEQRALLQEIIDHMYHRFVGIVTEARGLEEGQVQELTDGRILSSEAALEYRLIDQIGYWDDVVAKCNELLETTDVKIVRYEHTPELFEWIAEFRAPLNWQSWFQPEPPRLMYLWKP